VQKGGDVSFELQGEGELIEHCTVHSSAVTNTNTSATSTTNLDFRTADPMCLPAELSGFDAIFINDGMHLYTYTHTHLHLYTYTPIHIYTYTPIHLFTFSLNHIDTYTHIYIYTHTHTYTYSA
jgi:hypothetical protein